MKGLIDKESSLSLFSYDLPAPDRWQQTYEVFFNETQLEHEYKLTFGKNKEFFKWIETHKDDDENKGEKRNGLSKFRNLSLLWWPFLDKCFKVNMFTISARSNVLEVDDSKKILKILKPRIYNTKISIRRDKYGEICFPLVWYITDSTFFDEIDIVENPKFNPNNKSTKEMIPINNIMLTTRNALNQVLKRKFSRVQKSLYMGETNDFYAPNSISTSSEGKKIPIYNPDLPAPEFFYNTKLKKFSSINTVRDIEDGNTLQEYVIKSYLPVFTLIKEYITYTDSNKNLKFYERFVNYAHFFRSFDNWIFILRMRPVDQKSIVQYETYISKKMIDLTEEKSPFKELEEKIDKDLKNVEDGKYNTSSLQFVKIRLHSQNKMQYEELLYKYPFAMKIDIYTLSLVKDKNLKLNNDQDIKKELKKMGFYYSIPANLVDKNKIEDEHEAEYRKEIEKKILKLDFYASNDANTKTFEEYVEEF